MGVLAEDLPSLAPKGDIDKIAFLHAFACFVLVAAVAGQCEVGDGFAGGQFAAFGRAGEVADEVDFIDAGHGVKRRQ